MHFVLFHSSVEEAAGHPRTEGLDLLGDADLDRMRAGDVLWLVTRLGAVRRTPGLCGRLRVDRVKRISREGEAERAGPESDETVGGRMALIVDAEDPLRGPRHQTHRLITDPAGSSRCTPFECEAIRSWDIWRRQFRGITPLSTRQGQTLDTVWVRQAPRGT